MTAVVILAVLFLLFVPYAPAQWAAAFIVLVVGGSWLYSETLRRSVEVVRVTETVRMFRHETARIELSVRNTGYLPVPMILVSDSSGELYTRDDSAFVLSVGACAHRRLRYHLRAHYRGVYQLGPVRMRFADPLGLFPIVREIPALGRVIVYPRHTQLELPRKLGTPVGVTRVSTPLAADTTRYRSLRDYVPGDDTRHIGWKATARHGSLKTREFTPTIDAPVLVFLNLNLRDYGPRHQVLAAERSVETAASLVMASVRARRSFRLHVHAAVEDVAHREVRGSGEDSALSALELLARAALFATGEATSEVMAGSVSTSNGERVCYVGPALPEAEIDRLLTAGVRPEGVELYYVQELSRRGVQRSPRGLSVHLVRLFGDGNGTAET